MKQKVRCDRLAMNLRSFKTQQHKQKGIFVILPHDVLEPQPNNPHGAYFTVRECAECGEVVLRTLSQFRIKQIEYLIISLADGRVNGAFSATDIIATLTMIPRDDSSARRAAHEKLYRTKLFRRGTLSKRNNDRHTFEYWSRQIGGTPVGSHHPFHKDQRGEGSIANTFKAHISHVVKSGQIPVLGGINTTVQGRQCLFTEQTIKWCLIVLDQKKAEAHRRAKIRDEKKSQSRRRIRKGKSSKRNQKVLS
ncbi:MAG: hypothetical protein AAB381_01750 [Patescibacteria group bacterium]